MRLGSALLQMKVDNQETPNSEPSADESYAGDTLGTGQLVKMGERKVLGVRWDPAMDQLILNLEQIAYSASRLEPTKRAIVSLVGCIYDPLGILSPVVISLKIFVQELCVAKMAWDQPLTGSTLEKWHQLVGQLGETSPILLSRCYLEGIPEQILSYHLCGFCDASLKAYAAVVYLILDTSTQRHIRILASKTRVAPLKTQTIPRLELLSALLLARLMDSVAHALEGEVSLASPHCFSDSTVAVFWIRGEDKTWKPFVQNRVQEIRALLPSVHWSHCPGQDNPADLPSRGCTHQHLSECQFWLTGPEWLKTAELHPIEVLPFQMPEECRPEMKVNKSEATHGLLSAVVPAGIGEVMDCKRYSSVARLLAVTANVQKFCRLARPYSSLPAESDTAKAEILWILETQKDLVKDPKFAQWKRQFNLFQDDCSIWRSRGRIENADVSYSTKYPILLPIEITPLPH